MVSGGQIAHIWDDNALHARLKRRARVVQHGVWRACVVLLISILAACSSMAQDAVRRIAMDDLLALRDLSGLRISPDGMQVAFALFETNAQDNRYSGSWHVLSLSTGMQVKVADAGDLHPRAYQGRVSHLGAPPPPEWSPDGKWLVFLRREHDHTQLWKVQRDGEGAEQITYNASDVQAVRFSSDGRKLLFQTEPSIAQLQSALKAEGQTGFLYDERWHPFYDLRPLYPRDSASGTVAAEVLTLAAERVASGDIWAFELEKGVERRATADEMSEFRQLASPGRLPGRPNQRGQAVASSKGALAWAEARDPTRRGVYAAMTLAARMPSATSDVYCRGFPCDDGLIDAIWWRGETEVVFLRREGLRWQDRALYVWRPLDDDLPRLIYRTSDRFGDRAPSRRPFARLAHGGLHC